jgi:hypothetical protein
MAKFVKKKTLHVDIGVARGIKVVKVEKDARSHNPAALNFPVRLSLQAGRKKGSRLAVRIRSAASALIRVITVGSDFPYPHNSWYRRSIGCLRTGSNLRNGFPSRVSTNVVSYAVG